MHSTPALTHPEHGSFLSHLTLRFWHKRQEGTRGCLEEEAWYGDVEEDMTDSEGRASSCEMADISNGERGKVEAQVLVIFSTHGSARHDSYTSVSSDSLMQLRR
jgi:hypothetical protein